MTADLELQQLAHRYVDGQATAEQIERLNQRLRENADARQWFIDLLNVDSALAAVAPEWAPDAELVGSLAQTTATDESSHATAPTTIPPLGSIRRSMARWALGVAASVALLALGWGWQLTTPRVFATVQNTAGVEELVNGAMLGGERYRIEAGAVDLITARGARVVIEAPAEFRFESAQRFHLTHGRLSANVPPSAKGFTVVTPTGQAVDLGTNFGVDAPAGREAEIHVFKGEVIAQSSSGGKRQSLLEGEAFRLQSGAGAPRELRSAAFIQPEEVTSLHAALEAGQRARADVALEQLRRDPALIALLDFESDQLPDGVYRMGQGRWPGARAPEFVNVGDHMKLDVGGDRQWPQLTLAAWTRLDRLGEPYQSLFHTDGWSAQPGQVHWMVTRHTTMRLALFGNTLAPGSIEREQYPDSQASVLPEQGRWVHLATVYDSVERTVRFYLNGQFDSRTRQEIAHPARLGPAQIGNWNQRDRRLSGRMDELLLLGRALSDEEVRSLYAAGNPYR